ncbi:hypothetical protein A0128_20365 [Leptospira tipperaryensis]|uniref:Uncharacterized protein n=1 Tax=Leptospira tipperaryensis TaxID=2564040 RepID=A0A1D7V3G0_9LEPT|nr:hypothetical protein [Leptospira tipperaryensis]AOP36374.1 hypothetical protein A0128_20365 [Leptospira tipperaryensis]
MKNHLLSQLELAYPPISNYSFTFIKTEKVVQKYIKDSKLYIIIQRPEYSFKVLSITLGQFVSLQIIQSGEIIAEFELDIFQPAINTDNVSTLDIEIGTYSRDKIFNGGEYPVENVHGIKIWEGDDKFKAWFTPEKILFEYSRNIIRLEKVKLHKYPLTSKVLYVGQSVKQDIWDRLTGHETLQDILSKEFALEASTIPTHEIAIVLLRIFDSQHLKEIDSIKDFQNDSKISPETIYLDFEKLLIKHYDPEYNGIKYKRYPESVDGLYRFGLKTIGYAIRDDLVLYSKKSRDAFSRSGKTTEFIIQNNQFRVIEINGG